MNQNNNLFSRKEFVSRGKFGSLNARLTGDIPSLSIAFLSILSINFSILSTCEFLKLYGDELLGSNTHKHYDYNNNPDDTITTI